MQVLAQTGQWITLLVPAQLTSGEEALKALMSSSVMQGIDVDQSLRDNFVTAVREVLWNAIEHGGKLDPVQQIRIDLLHSNRALSCFVKDPGPGFRIEKLAHAAINNPEEDALKHASIREKVGMRPGGYGILLASNFADELIYNEHGNEVLIVKYLQ
ncbi:MAG: ATP-binding protein [Acidobacteria bacterium]|jgi:anti-sigma regulatory factor (Ser/Thr protein kinase)|nr:ATP-binding protein [Acidobacteriota bacterium]